MGLRCEEGGGVDRLPGCELLQKSMAWTDRGRQERYWYKLTTAFCILGRLWRAIWRWGSRIQCGNG
jgi:hypothetical protein